VNSKPYGKILHSEDAHGLNGNGAQTIASADSSAQGGNGAAPRIERSKGRWDIEPGTVLITEEELERRISQKVDEALALLGGELKALAHQAIVKPLSGRELRIARRHPIG